MATLLECGLSQSSPRGPAIESIWLPCFWLDPLQIILLTYITVIFIKHESDGASSFLNILQWLAIPGNAIVKQKLLIWAIKTSMGSSCLCPRSLLMHEPCSGHTELLTAPSPTVLLQITPASAHTFCPGGTLFFPVVFLMSS